MSSLSLFVVLICFTAMISVEGLFLNSIMPQRVRYVSSPILSRSIGSGGFRALSRNAANSIFSRRRGRSNVVFVGGDLPDSPLSDLDNVIINPRSRIGRKLIQRQRRNNILEDLDLSFF